MVETGVGADLIPWMVVSHLTVVSSLGTLHGVPTLGITESVQGFESYSIEYEQWPG